MDKRTFNFLITKHARERFVERFTRESVHFHHLSRCHGCETCRELAFYLIELTENNRERWDKIINAKLRDAEDVRIFQNCSPFMDYMHSHYGYHRFRFFVESNILFILKESEGLHIVLSCMNVNNPVNGSTIIADFINRKKLAGHRPLSPYKLKVS